MSMRPFSARAFHAQWKELDSAFTWGLMCHYPDQRLIFELLFDSALRLPEVHSNALVQLAVQIGVYTEKDNTSSTPSFQNRHADLIYLVARQAFRTNEFRPYRPLLTVGWDFGEFLSLCRLGFAEDADLDADRLSQQIDRLTQELEHGRKPPHRSFQHYEDRRRNPFSAILGMIEELKEVQFDSDRCPNHGQIIRIVRDVSADLRLANNDWQFKPPAQIEGVVKEYGRVQLLPFDAHPTNVCVDGKQVETLSETRYSLIEALVDAAEGGLTIDQLNSRSNAGDGRKTLKTMAKSEPWKSVIQFPGRKGNGGYRIASAI